MKDVIPETKRKIYLQFPVPNLYFHRTVVDTRAKCNSLDIRMREERNCSTCKLNPIHRTDINIFKYFGGEEVNDGFEIPHFVRLFR